MKNKTKKRLIRICRMTAMMFAVLNIFTILCGMGGKAYAEVDFGLPKVTKGAAVENGIATIIMVAIGKSFGGLPLIIIYVFKLALILVGFLVQTLMSGAFSTLEGSVEWFGLEKILFAGASVKSEKKTYEGSTFLDVNFFNLNVGGSIGTFREQVAKWYYILRLICVAILLVMLIYVGIRMAISTVASDQARYKQMLVDWVTSLALLFLLHYIIIFIIQINNSLVTTLMSILKKEEMLTLTGDLIKTLVLSILLPGVEGFFAAVIYAIYLGQIFSFFILYVKRMITVGFLIMIAPLITITYSLDKMGDNKAQALNAWLKELAYNILIQPFHCIIYMAFFSAIVKMVNNNVSVGAYIFAIMIMGFMKKAEEILRHIFHFEARSMSSISESGQNLMNATGKLVGVGMVAGNVFSSVRAAGGFKNLGQKYSNYKLDKSARKALRKDFENKNFEGKYESFKEFKESTEGQEKFATHRTNAKEMAEKAKAKKQEKIQKKYDKKHGEGAYEKMIEDKKAEQIADGMTEDKLREAYDAQHGEGTYDRLKKVAGGKSSRAKDAQAKLDEHKNNYLNGAFMSTEEKDKLDKDVRNRENAKISNSSKPKRVISGVSKAVGNVHTNMREFAQSDYGKVVMAATKDSMKVAGTLAMAAFAYGYKGELNDAISGGQVGYGLMNSALDGTKKTVLDGAADHMGKYCELTGQDPAQASAIMNNIQAKSAAGQLDPKVVNDLMKDLESVIKNNLKNQGDPNADQKAKDFIKNLQLNAAVEGRTLNADTIKDSVNKLGLDEMGQAEVLSSAQEFSETYVESLLAGDLQNGKAINMDSTELGERIAPVVQKNTTINKNENQNITETPITNIQNSMNEINNTINSTNMTQEVKQQIVENKIEEIQNIINQIDQTTIENNNLQQLKQEINNMTVQNIDQSKVDNIQQVINNINGSGSAKPAGQPQPK